MKLIKICISQTTSSLSTNRKKTHILYFLMVDTFFQISLNAFIERNSFLFLLPYYYYKSTYTFVYSAFNATANLCLHIQHF